MEQSERRQRRKQCVRPEFDYHRAIFLAQQILAAPPVKSFSDRPALREQVLFRLALPAEYCLEANKSMRKAHMKHIGYLREKNRKELWAAIQEQKDDCSKWRNSWPLDTVFARPQLIAVKFSSRPNDAGSNPAKRAIDMIAKPNKRDVAERLGVISSDARSVVQQQHWWEYLPPNERAFVLIEVRV